MRGVLVCLGISDPPEEKAFGSPLRGVGTGPRTRDAREHSVWLGLFLSPLPVVGTQVLSVLRSGTCGKEGAATGVHPESWLLEGEGPGWACAGDLRGLWWSRGPGAWQLLAAQEKLAGYR